MARHRLAALLTTGCGLSAVAAGWLLWGAPQPGPADAGSLPAGVHSPTSHTTAASPPTRVRGPNGLDAAVVPVAALGDGALALPEDLRTGGWWALGAAAGSSEGTVLIAGHADTRADGLGPFAALHRIPLDARVEVTGADDQVRAYRLTARRTYRREQLPTDLFAGDGPHRLVLVTCAGPYDRAVGRYQRNLVLYATPIEPNARVANEPPALAYGNLSSGPNPARTRSGLG
ncbi:class F sortase [Streptomyces flavidovirens]|uniref:Class F sortase n=1 Tax=Streptomyces flavidovirens TaxID=67298 RepID=A0ABW6RMK2_9ACTN